MARPEEERYTDLLRHIAAPSSVDPAGLVASAETRADES